MTWWQAALAYFVGPVVVALGTWAAAKTAAKGSESAAHTSAAVEKEAGAIDGYHVLVTDLQTDLARLRADHEALKDDHDELKADHERLKGQSVKDQRKIRHLVNYIRTLSEHLQRLGEPIPDAPAGLDIDGTLRP